MKVLLTATCIVLVWNTFADITPVFGLNRKIGLNQNFGFNKIRFPNTFLLRPTDNRLKPTWFTFKPNLTLLWPSHDFVETKISASTDFFCWSKDLSGFNTECGYNQSCKLLKQSILRSGARNVTIQGRALTRLHYIFLFMLYTCICWYTNYILRLTGPGLILLFI